jgi:lipopolysaccharide export system protein LptA
MRIRIERLRVWLLAGVALVVVVVAGFIGAARYLRRHWLAKIPEKLGANVKVDTSGITWSHTNQGQTDYVVHAAKEVEHTDGKIALHDVWIRLCGRQQQRADMVRGDDWEYDQKDGVIRALGVVHIELRDAGGKPGCSATDDAAAAEAAGAKTLRVTTSDLIYMQKLGVAATSAPIEFESGALKGNAVGADYASDSGVLMLHSAVNMTGLSAGAPVHVNAASAELDGQERVVRLTAARYTTGTGDTARTAAADQAVLHLRADQTLERIEAQGNVTLQAGGGMVTAAKAAAAMNAAGHPVSALLTGGVRYVAQDALTERRGEAEQAAIAFDGKASPQARHAVFTGAAHFVERGRADAKAGLDTRELSAAKLEVALAPGAAGKNEVRDAEATGGARFSEVSAGKAAKSGAAQVAAASVITEIAGDDLKAHFGAGGANAGSRPQLETINGTGHTLVHQVNAAGVEQTSAGDTLDAKFRPSAPGAAKKSAADLASADDLASAAQSGHVVVTRREPAKRAKGGKETPASIEEAQAPQAAYDGDSDRMTLDGGVQMTDAGSLLRAGRVVLEHATGNAQAFGGVSVEYAQSASGAQQNAEPAHVLADHAELNHATDVVTFYGAPVRMWQAGNQVQAPVIELARTAKRLVASGAPGVSGTVHTVLVSAGSNGAGVGQAAGSTQACASDAKSAKDGKTSTQPQVVRVTSGGLVYSQLADEADFTGGFRAETADATVRANAGTVYLKGTKSGESAAQPAQNVQGIPALEGKVDHVVASGQVTVDRPGLRATGERLLYTAADGNSLLTGDAKTPPKAVDARGNMTTGAALEFHRACGGAGGDTVIEVLNSVPGGPAVAAGVHTEVQADAKREHPAR